MNRRKLLKMGLGTAATLSLAGASKVIASSCGLTPEQTEGPFYPVTSQKDVDTDLTQIKGNSQVAEGEVIYVKGVVQDSSCTPIENALVEIWQANHYGKYNHPADLSTNQFDKNFQYWGQALTNKNGEYLFKTVIPGEYAASTTWMRPPHIHYKVQKRGYEELTTQLYFEGYANNSTDLILNSLSTTERSKVVVPLTAGLVSADPLIDVAQFDITLKSAGP